MGTLSELLFRLTRASIQLNVSLDASDYDGARAASTEVHTVVSELGEILTGLTDEIDARLTAVAQSKTPKAPF